MYATFNEKEISQAVDKSADEIINRHAMSVEHAEILGQFLDCTALSPKKLQSFLLLSTKKYNTACSVGYWYDVGSLSCRCSNCGCKSPQEYKFCPNCGAFMEDKNNA